MKFRRTRKLNVLLAPDLTALINVLFLLLLYFMLSSTFVAQNSINIQMATAQGTTSFEQKDVSVTLMHGTTGPGGKGPIYVDGTEVQDMDELARVLSNISSGNPDAKVMIRPDARIDSGRLIEVLGITYSVGIEYCTIAAQPTSEEPTSFR